MSEPKYIGVIGAGECDEKLYRLAEEVGIGIAARGGILVCGGLGGVMEGACRGARSAGGVTIGILPGENRLSANGFVDYAIPTGLGEGRNFLIVRACDALIAVGGGFGTLSEIALALKTGKKVIGLKTWELEKSGIIQTKSVEKAVRLAFGEETV